MTKEEVKSFIEERVFPNNKQAITGEGLQEALFAIADGITENAISYTAQELTQEQQYQARKNIDGANSYANSFFLIQAGDVDVFMPPTSKYSKVSLFKNCTVPVFYKTSAKTEYVFLNWRGPDFRVRTGIYRTAQGIGVVALTFEFDEKNDEIRVVSEEHTILPINTTNGTAVSLGSGTASGDNAFVLGSGTASGDNAFVLGSGTASGDYTVSLGRNNTTDGAYAFTNGRNNTTSGGYAVAIGQNCKSKAGYGFAMGQTITTLNSSEVGFGKYNISVESSDPAEATAFSIGNGKSTTPSNLFEIKANGDIYINGKKAVISFEE